MVPGLDVGDVDDAGLVTLDFFEELDDSSFGGLKTALAGISSI